MAFADPQAIPTSGAPVSVPRTGFGQDAGSFKSSDGAFELLFSHKYGNRTRHMARLNHSGIQPDPLVAGMSRPVSMSVVVTIDVPKTGYTNDEAKGVAGSLLAFLSAASNAKLAQLLGGES